VPAHRLFSASQASIHSLYTSTASLSLLIFAEKRSLQVLHTTLPICERPAAVSTYCSVEATLKRKPCATHLCVIIQSRGDALVGVAEGAVESDVELGPLLLWKRLAALPLPHALRGASGHGLRCALAGACKC